ncbi:hypothetical protein EDC14_101754 [Hydrogenispora ethanolica]|jgi:hypothetical protein|uniref:Uncharacterized protein n=1 Tax=Hydrogenispora ethanolica TaxID=1082276 RepID=A0A4R1RHA1_HYDET|nr:hypothetical protein [Hydrogenispora ethanolica]TCL65306.1 hypothetical protein EDC14_101754 [Hydrogenispora ethanolica]
MMEVGGVSYVAMLGVLLVAFYTVLFGLEQWREKNYGGGLAVMVLALLCIGLPFYMLFLNH